MADSGRRRHWKNHATGISACKRKRSSLRKCEAPGQFSVADVAVEIPNRILVSEETEGVTGHPDSEGKKVSEQVLRITDQESQAVGSQFKENEMNRPQFFISTAAGAVASAYAATSLVGVARALAQDGQEPLGGQPAPGASASVKDFDYQVKYQRAFEVVLWAMPAVSIYGFRRVSFQALGGFLRGPRPTTSVTGARCSYVGCRSGGQK